MNNFYIEIKPKEQPVELRIQYGSCTDKIIEDYNSNELACVKVKYNEKQNFRRSSCIHLELSNKANIAFKDNRLTIEKVSINEEDLFSIRKNNLPCDINSGDKDDNGEEKRLSIIVDYDRKLCLEKVQSSPYVGMSVNIEYSINGGDTKYETLHFQIEFYEQIISSIYSLDYGTTGIVLSKYEGDRVSSVILRDVDYISDEEQEGQNNNQDEREEPLERDKTIVSSISILKKIRDNNRKATLVLAPSRLEYDQGAVFILSPTKFLIGQPKIPFVDLYAKKFDEIEDFPGHITMIKAEDIIRHSYKNVFERFDHDGVRKLILTYPNTYVPEQIRILREILKDEFKLLDDSNIHFVPESDSVVTYYVEMRRKSPIGFPKKKERILIYDMGAGTLDISYVIISKDQNEYEIQLEKRIGIPVAGNYLDYELYEIIKDEVSDKKTSPRTIKDYIKNYLKVDLSEKENCEDEEDNKRDDTKVGQGQTKSYLNTLYPTDLFKSDSKLVRDEIRKKIDDSYFIKVCGELIFHVLFPGKKDKWNEEIDTFVLSGRASQFGPLVSKILGKVGKKKIEFLPQLKTCVSEGAIYYQRIKEDPENKKFRFISHSHYLRLGAIYAIDNKDGGLSYNYCELINPDKAKWEEADDINGTLYVQLEGEGTMNLQRDDDVLFVQTLLSEDDVKNYYVRPMNDALASLKGGKSVDKYGEYDCFIHKLFTVSPEGILTNREKIKTEVVIDKDNQVTVNCIDEDENSYELEPQYFVENVENNEYYKRAAWPSNSERL